jgi:hypothetical protein
MEVFKKHGFFILGKLATNGQLKITAQTADKFSRLTTKLVQQQCGDSVEQIWRREPT